MTAYGGKGRALLFFEKAEFLTGEGSIMSAFRKFRYSALSALTLCAVAATAAAATVSVHPSMVIADNNGAVLGPVVGIANNGRPLVLVADPDEPQGTPRGILLRVEKEAISAEDDFEVFYSSTGCTGTPFIRPASARSGLAEMTDINYSVGLNGSDLVVYKAAGAGVNTSFQSFFRSTTGACSDLSSNQDMVEATQVINLSVDHPPPYGVVFPGLQ